MFILFLSFFKDNSQIEHKNVQQEPLQLDNYEKSLNPFVWKNPNKCENIKFKNSKNIMAIQEFLEKIYIMKILLR